MTAERRPRLTRANIPALIGTRSGMVSTDQVASQFGVSRQRIGQIRREQSTFPRPQIELDGGPLWIRAGIEVWASVHRPASVPMGSPFVPHGARLLATAETLSAMFRLSY